MKNVAAKKPWENVCSLQQVNKKNLLNPLGKRNLKQNSMLCVFMRTHSKTVDFPYIRKLLTNARTQNEFRYNSFFKKYVSFFLYP